MFPRRLRPAVTCRSSRADRIDKHIEFEAKARIDTPQEAEYYRNGGILPYVLRQLIASERIGAEKIRMKNRAPLLVSAGIIYRDGRVLVGQRRKAIDIR